MKIDIKFSGTSLAQYAAKIERLGKQADIEMQRGLNAAGDVVRTNVRRALKVQTSVLRANIINAEVGSRPAHAGDLNYRIVASGKGLPIKDFAVQASKGSPVTATVWGVPVEFQRSFVTSARGLLRARRGTSREPIRSLYGPSLAKELVKGQSLKTFEHAVVEIVEPIVSARLARLMG